MNTYNRLVVIENPVCTKSDEALAVDSRLRQHGFTVGEVVRTSSSDTSTNIADIYDAIKEGDRIIVAGGDGTAMQTVNAVMRHGVDPNEQGISIGFMPLGNFRDVPVSTAGRLAKYPEYLAAHDAPLQPLHPLDINTTTSAGVSTKWYSPAYTTAGWTAHAAKQFSDPEVRARLKQRPHLARALTASALVADYTEHRHKRLPWFTTNTGGGMHKETTDIVALNGKRIGGYLGVSDRVESPDYFHFTELDVSQLLPNIRFLARSLVRQMPSQTVSHVDVAFEYPASIPIQSEGEYRLLHDVTTLSIAKHADQAVNVVGKP